MKKLFPLPLPKDFDSVAYKICNPTLATLTDIECELHYLREGRNNGLKYLVDVNPRRKREEKQLELIATLDKELPKDFNLNAYKKHNPDIADKPDLWLIRHFLLHGQREGRIHYEVDYSLLPEDFDCSEYRRLNPDIKTYTDEKLKSHYVTFGIRESRDYKLNLPADYQREIYRFFNADLSKLDDIQLDKHFLKYAKIENRRYTDTLFDLEYFKQRYGETFNYKNYTENVKLIKSQKVEDIINESPSNLVDIALINHESTIQGATHYLYSLLEYIKENDSNINIQVFEPNYEQSLFDKYGVYTKYVYHQDPTILFHLIKKSGTKTVLVNCINVIVEKIRTALLEEGIRIIDHSHEIKKHYSVVNSEPPAYVVSKRISKQWNNIPSVQPPFLNKQTIQQLEETDSVLVLENEYGQADLSKVTIGMCGTLSLRKNYLLFKDLAKLFPQKNFLWIGGTSCEEFKNIQNLYHIPNTPNPFGYYKILDYFFLTSIEDPCPYVVLENLYLNNKVIVFRENIFTNHSCKELKDLYIECPGYISLRRAQNAIEKHTINKKELTNANGKNYVLSNFTKPQASYIKDLRTIKQPNRRRFKTYDPSAPLIYLHLYKTAGTSVNQIFQTWYGGKFIKHKDGSNTDKRDISCTSENIKKYNISGPLFFGHFNHDGMFEWPSECTQFITMLRDPFDLQVSAFYYAKKNGLPLHVDNVEEYVLTSDFHYSFTNIFTKEKITLNNYKEIIAKYFIAIGSLKNYEKSIKNFALQLGKPFDSSFLEIRKNVSADSKNYFVPNHLRSLHEEVYALEHTIYKYINETYEY